MPSPQGQNYFSGSYTGREIAFDVLVRMVNTVSFRVDATAVEFKHLHVSTHARVYLRELHIAFLLRNTLCRAYTKNNIANK